MPPETETIPDVNSDASSEFGTSLTHVDFGSLDLPEPEPAKTDAEPAVDESLAEGVEATPPDNDGMRVRFNKSRKTILPAMPDKPEDAEKEPKKEAAKPKTEAPAVNGSKETNGATPAPTDDEDAFIASVAAAPGAHPEYKANINKLKKLAQEARAKNFELSKQLKEREAIPAIPPEVQQKIEALEKRAKELEEFEFLAKPETSAFIKREYDEKIQSGSEKIINRLIKSGMKEKAFSTADGKPGLSAEALRKMGGAQAMPYEFWANLLTKAEFDPLTAKMLDTELLNLYKLTGEKEEAISGVGDKRKEFLGRAEQQSQAASKDYQAQVQARLAELVRDVPYAQKKAVPTDATPEQKAEIEANNAFHDKASKIFPSLVLSNDAKKRTDIAAGFIQGLYLEEKNAILLKQIEEQKAKLTGYEKKLQQLGGASSLASGGKLSPASNAKPSSAKSLFSLTGDEAIAELDKL